MEEGKYLNGERYQRNNQKVRKIGKILLIVGIITLVIGVGILVFGFVGIGNTVVKGIQSAEIYDVDNTQIASGAFGSFGLIALGGVTVVLGFALTGAGIICTVIGHRREIAAYTTQQAMPIVQESVEKITPTVANAAGTIAQSISKGINDGKRESEQSNQ